MAGQTFIDPGWPSGSQFGFSQAVRAGDLVVVSGQMPTDGATGALLGAGDIKAQTRAVFENMATVLAVGGLALSDVIEIVSYHTDFRDIAGFAEVKAEFFPQGYPAWTSLGVTALALPGQLVEVKATAYAG